MKILIADDDAPWVRMLSRYFSGGGHEVYSCGTWQAAGALALRAMPDAILLDSCLPDGEAVDFCAFLRADARFDGTALVMVSGAGPEAARGADGMLTKCEPLAKLDAAIAAALSARRAAGGGR